MFLSGCEPVRVWFAWHPTCGDARALAEKLAAALGELDGSSHASNGVPSYFATSDDPARPPLTIPDGRGDEKIIVVPLLDDHFVASPAWRRWLRDLRETTATLLPVALAPSAYRLHAVRDLGYLPFEDDRESLRRAILVELARLLLEKRPRLFLSYTRTDAHGAAAALALRTAIARHPRLDFFLDVDGLTAGDDFPAALDRAMDLEADAMLAVHSDHYATRPWCMRELASIRRPRREASGIWHLRTLLVVEAICDGVSRIPGPMAGAPVCRYDVGREPVILDRLIRALVLNEYHRRRAEHLVRHVDGLDPADVIDWTPDPYTTTELQRQGGPRPSSICCPGRTDDVDSPGAAMDPIPGSRTFDGLLEQRTSARARPRTVVGLSIGVPPRHDLVARGLGEAHILAALARLARLLIGHGVDVSFGGAIDAAITRRLSRTLEAYLSREDALVDRRIAADELPDRSMLIYFGRAEGDITDQRVAEGLGSIRFVAPVEIDALDAPDDSVLGENRRAPVLRKHAAHGIRTSNRWHMNGRSRACDGVEVHPPIARILIGGKTTGYSGLLPGIFEEALYASERGVPLFVVGALGGAAWRLGRALLFREAIERPRDAVGGSDAWWEALERIESADNGLTDEDNRRLFEARDLDTVIRLLSRGLTALLKREGRLAETAPAHS